MSWNQVRRSSIYDEGFFDGQVLGALRSARPVARLVVELFKPTSVVDVGCGLGAWLAALNELGVGRIFGIDGDHVNPARLLIDPAIFLSTDLTKLDGIPGTYDLAMCLEVGEHLPPASSNALVGALTRAAPLVMFSAAIPGQGGTQHINERWPSYWHEQFRSFGYRLYDPIRPRIRDDPSIEWWYRQNIMLFASPEAQTRYPSLVDYAIVGEEIEWVHVSLLKSRRSFRSALKMLPGSIWMWSRLKPFLRRRPQAYPSAK